MREQPTVIWEATRTPRSRSPHELTTFEAYCLVNQIAKLAPKRFVIGGEDPLSRGDVDQLVDHARKRGLDPAVTLAPTLNSTAESIARLRRNGLSRIIVSLQGSSGDRHDTSCGVAGSYGRTLNLIGLASSACIDVEVDTLVTSDNVANLDAIYDLIEPLGVAAWNVHLPVPRAGVDAFSRGHVAQTIALVERLRRDGLTEIRLIDPGMPAVFITSEGYVRNGEFALANSGDLRQESLPRICRQLGH